MTLPWQPEPLEQLRARYPAAVADVVDVESVQVGAVLRPGEQRRHVFDVPNGVRLIVSRDRLPGGRVLTHLSASIFAEHCAPGLRARLDAVNDAEQLALWLDALATSFREVSGSNAELRFIGLSPGKKVPHWEVLP